MRKPIFTSGDDYSYAGSDWWLDAYKNGGVWASGSSWKLTAGETGSLYMTIDPGLLFNDTSNSVVSLQLLDENSVVVSNLVADLTSGTGEQVFKQYAIPLTACANASRINMVVEQNSGELNVYTSIHPTPMSMASNLNSFVCCVYFFVVIGHLL